MQTSVSRRVRHYLCRGRRLVFGIIIICITALVTMDTLYGTFFETSVSNVRSDTYIAAVDRQNPTQNLPSSRELKHATITQRVTSVSRKILPKTTKTENTDQDKTSKTKETKPLPLTIDSFINTSPEEVLKQCLPTKDTSKEKTPFKVYVYDLPKRFNTDIQRFMTDDKQFSYCYNLDYCGTGTELYKINYSTQTTGSSSSTKTHIQSIRDTQQFALEPVIHYKMLNSLYRTSNPDEADLFYIPGYTGLNCLQFKKDSQQFVDELFSYLKKNETKYFYSGKQHVMALSKIQREQGTESCPVLKHPATENMTFVGIEKEGNPYWANGMYGKSIIVVPYPSYVHFIPHSKDETLHEYQNGLRNLNQTKFYLDVPDLDERDVTIFLAAGTRRSNFFRAKILDQFRIQTKNSYENVKKEIKTLDGTMPEQVMLVTIECSQDHRTSTIPWMQHSVYCLQPPGDSPTRKSIYDSILSGCIPVFFTNRFTTEYPFERFLDYKTFSYTIDEKLLQRYNKTILEIISGIPKEKTLFFHKNLRRVAKWFQYSLPQFDTVDSDDAFTLMMHEVSTRFNLSDTKKLQSTL